MLWKLTIHGMSEGLPFVMITISDDYDRLEAAGQRAMMTSPYYMGHMVEQFDEDEEQAW